MSVKPVAQCVDPLKEKFQLDETLLARIIIIGTPNIPQLRLHKVLTFRWISWWLDNVEWRFEFHIFKLRVIQWRNKDYYVSDVHRGGSQISGHLTAKRQFYHLGMELVYEIHCKPRVTHLVCIQWTNAKFAPFSGQLYLITYR